MATPQEPIETLPHTTTTVDPQTEYLYQNISHYPFDKDREYQAGLEAILGHEGTSASEDEIEQNAALVLQAQLFYFARKYNVQPIDANTYSAWVQTQTSHQIQQQQPSHLSSIQQPVPTTSPSDVEAAASAPASTSISAPPPLPAQPPPETQTQTSSSEPEPPYPTSFAAIVDLITRNIPIPGIEEIPTTVLEPGSSKIDKNPRRKKPWEKDASTTSPDAVEAETDTEITAQAQSETEAEHQTQIATMAEETPPTAAEAINVNGLKETGQGVVNILKPNAIPDNGLLSRE
ncbi:hypothetical protein PV11_01722 [Exophiala sideris]|uniref:Uncharacterized protein n=1 Tax=Exophiala sideris TaxID=1016849 RepID=A0A0D1WBI6_9EURO|nr:hypothetical protein PV11_01722 [Exophiala sideris]